MIGWMFGSQFTRYCLVGVIGFMLDAGVLQLLAVFSSIDLYMSQRLYSC